MEDSLYMGAMSTPATENAHLASAGIQALTPRMHQQCRHPSPFNH